MDLAAIEAMLRAVPPECPMKEYDACPGHDSCTHGSHTYDLPAMARAVAELIAAERAKSKWAQQAYELAWLCATLENERVATTKALRLAQLDREGDWATLADSLNSALREAGLPEVEPQVEAIKAGANTLLYALNRERAAHAATREMLRQAENNICIESEALEATGPDLARLARLDALLADRERMTRMLMAARAAARGEIGRIADGLIDLIRAALDEPEP